VATDLIQYQRNNEYNRRSTVQKKLSIPGPKCELFKKSFSFQDLIFGMDSLTARSLKQQEVALAGKPGAEVVPLQFAPRC